MHILLYQSHHPFRGHVHQSSFQGPQGELCVKYISASYLYQTCTVTRLFSDFSFAILCFPVGVRIAL